MITRTRRSQFELSTGRRVTKGYSRGRRAYDRRRRRFRLDSLTRSWRSLCQRDVCGNPYCDGSNRQIAADHIVPASDGGDNIWSNYGAMCRSCNAAKGETSLLIFLHGQSS